MLLFSMICLLLALTYSLHVAMFYTFKKDAIILKNKEDAIIINIIVKSMIQIII